MKISVEIKDERFIYDYDFTDGGRGTGSMPVTPSNLQLFANILTACSNNSKYEHDVFMEGLTAQSWILKHPDKHKEFIKKMKEIK